MESQRSVIGASGPTLDRLQSDMIEFNPTVSGASKVVRAELYSRGLGVGEVAAKYDVDVAAILWIVKAKGLAEFPARDMGDPPAYVEKAFVALTE